MPTPSYHAFASAALVWGSLMILLAFGSFIESRDNSNYPRVSTPIHLASAVDPLPPQPIPSPPAEPIPPSPAPL